MSTPAVYVSVLSVLKTGPSRRLYISMDSVYMFFRATTSTWPKIICTVYI